MVVYLPNHAPNPEARKHMETTDIFSNAYSYGRLREMGFMES